MPSRPGASCGTATDRFFLKACLIVPLFTEQFFEGVSNDFEKCDDIGTVFNSYDARRGRERVHMNSRARKMLDRKAGDRSLLRSRTTYADVTPESVRDALWIYQYGVTG